MSTLVVADLDRRLRAFCADLAIVSGTALGVAVLAHRDGSEPVLPALAAAGGLCGALVALLGTTGRTPGLSVAGLRVVSDHDGRPIGIDAAALRMLVVALATAVCGLGLVALAATSVTDPAGRRRGWHDRLVGSVVVEVQPVPMVVEPEDDPPQPIVNLTAARLRPARRTPVASPRAPTRIAVPATREPVRWGLVVDDEETDVDGVVVIGGSASAVLARVEVASDGALVVTDLGTVGGAQVRRRGADRPIGARRSVTLLEGDVVTLGDRTVTVVRRACAALPSGEPRR